MNGHNAASHHLLMIDEAACRACGKCLAARVCTTGALLRIDPGDSPFLDTSLCRGCLVCMDACPFGAVVRVRSAGNGSEDAPHA